MNRDARRYPELEVSGSAREMGRQLGEAVGEQIAAFVEMSLSSVQKTVSITRERALQIAQQSLRRAQQYDDQIVEELRGINEVTGISLDDLMLLQVRNQLRNDAGAGVDQGGRPGGGNRSSGRSWTYPGA